MPEGRPMLQADSRAAKSASRTGFGGGRRRADRRRVCRPGWGLPAAAGRAGQRDPLNRSELNSVLGPDAIPAIDNPSFLPAARASSIPANMPIIGVVLNGEAHAYPIPLLSSHEIVNDRLGGTDIAVTW